MDVTSPARCGPGRAARTLASWALAALAAALAAPAHGAGSPLALVGVRIVDVERGRLLAPRTVVVEHGRIAAILRDPERVPRDARRIALDGRYLVPGLVDAHVHLFNTYSKRPPNDWALPMFVAHGVTSVREMAADADSMRVVAEWRDELARGVRVGPRIVAVAMPVRGDDVRAGVTEIARAGGDAVKVFSETSPARFAEMVAAARTAGLAVEGHAPSRLRALDAARAGLRVNEHLMQLFEACAEDEAAHLAARAGLEREALARTIEAQAGALLERPAPRACARTAHALARIGQAQVPTLVLLQPDRGAPAQAHDDPLWPLLRGDEQARWHRIMDSGARVRGAALAPEWRAARRIVAALAAAKVDLVAGTDAPMPLVYPGRSLHEELALLVEAGLTPAQALASATSVPARVFGLGDAGTIAEGRRADLVLLARDPLEDIAHTRAIVAVVAAGRWLDRAALDAMLAARPD